MSEKRQKMYANGINLGGLISDRPKLVTLDPETQTYWDDEGNFDVKRMGTCHEEGRITFASDKHTEVVAWTFGVKATMRILSRWCDYRKEEA